MRMVIKAFTLALACALLISALLPVTAYAAEASGWVELLEYSSVQTNGSNAFTMGQTGSVTVPLHGDRRLRKVDVLMWNPGGQRPTSATCTAGGKTLNLEILAIGSNLTRIVGYIPEASYKNVRIDLKKATTSVQTYEVLSFKVTPVGIQEFVAEAEVYLEDYGNADYYSTNYNIPLWRDTSSYSSDGSPWLARVHVYDWEKYDTLSIWGSATNASIESIRASVGTTALDIVVNYIDAESYETAIDGDPAYWATAEWGKYLYNITIDLTGVDRSLTTTPLYIYFTGSYDLTVSATFNCQYVNGSVATADTTSVTWWNRFTDFFTGLLGGSSAEGDDYAEEMHGQAQEMEEAVDQMEQVTRPAVEDVEVSLDGYVDAQSMQVVGQMFNGFLGNPLVTSMVMISLLVSLAAYVIYGKH